ncbi:type II toxin-antitoxin system VapB family antitoxin [Rickettsia endosymbiont of Polydrusus tereticollis]|uniref:antitoxin n=1 Tax=Rickettsia endosymbiont of Polydrusus tereticollis TaxID=3066251 RepID=UPI003133184E
MNKVKVFMHGHSQAVRLPKKFRFKTKEVSIIQLGNGLILQPMPKTWKEVFQELASIPTDDILIGREDLPPQERKYFE